MIDKQQHWPNRDESLSIKQIRERSRYDDKNQEKSKPFEELTSKRRKMRDQIKRIKGVVYLQDFFLPI